MTSEIPVYFTRPPEEMAYPNHDGPFLWPADALPFPGMRLAWPQGSYLFDVSRYRTVRGVAWSLAAGEPELDQYRRPTGRGIRPALVVSLGPVELSDF